MKKTIIAIAVAAAAAAAPMVANAAGTVYGQLQVEISDSDAGTQLVDNARGRIGYKGSEELGNGLTMIGKMEFKVDTADGVTGADASLTKREMMVGMKAGWGTFTMGRLKSPYKYTGGVKYDAFVATTLEARKSTMSGGSFGHNGFLSDSVGIDLMGGKLKVTLGLGDLDGNDGDLAIGYKHKMGKKNELIFAHVSDDSASYTGTKVGGKFGPVKFQVELTDANGTEDTNVFAAYGMKAAGGKVIVQGGIASGDTYTVDDVTDITIAYQKKFTKKSRYFAGVKVKTGGKTVADDQDDTIVTYGMRFDY